MTMGMIYDANGEPITRSDSVYDKLNAKAAEVSDSLSRALAEQERKNMETERVIRFRSVNGLPIRWPGSNVIDSNIQWDGSKYAAYGSLQ